jgi:acetyl-CoA carboxylase carboxyl transferase subunit alpha
LKLTAQDLEQFGVIDEIVPEPLGGAHRDPGTVVASVLGSVDVAVARLAALSPERLLEERYRKYRQLGSWQA